MTTKKVTAKKVVPTTTKRRLHGLVVSDKMDKTIVVRVDRVMQHAKYKKTLVRSARYKAHDPLNTGKVGMLVTIESCRPVSRDKCWKLISIDKE